MRSAIRWFKCKLKPPKNCAVYGHLCLFRGIHYYVMKSIFRRRDLREVLTNNAHFMFCHVVRQTKLLKNCVRHGCVCTDPLLSPEIELAAANTV